MVVVVVVVVVCLERSSRVTEEGGAGEDVRVVEASAPQTVVNNRMATKLKLVPSLPVHI